MKKERKKNFNKRKTPTWTRKEILLEDGRYRLGPYGKYFLSEKALNHVINGDFSERLLCENGVRTGEKEIILKGGLHTCQAWIDFKNIRNDIMHLRKFNSNKNKF